MKKDAEESAANAGKGPVARKKVGGAKKSDNNLDELLSAGLDAGKKTKRAK